MKARRVKTRRKEPETLELRVAKLEALLAGDDDEIYQQDKFDHELMVLLTHIIATITDLQDVALVASTAMLNGNLRDACASFFDATVAISDVTEKVQLLYRMYPDKMAEIQGMLNAHRSV